jgi:signal transduction histidine kinase
MVGRSIRVLIPTDRQEEEDLELRTIRRGQSLPSFDTLRIHRDGHLVPVAVSVSPVLDENGRVIGGAKIARDLSPSLDAERALRLAHQRLLALMEAARILSEAPEVVDVLHRSIQLAHQALTADAYAVWQLSPEGRWTVAHATGLSEAFTARIVAMEGVRSGRAQQLLHRPLIIPEVADAPLLATLIDAYRLEGIRSMAIFPLLSQGEPRGTLVFYFRQSRTLSDLEVQTGQALAHLTAAAMAAVGMREEQRRLADRAAQARHRAEFLSEAAKLLNESLDYQQTLSALARLAVPAVADWCAVDMLDEHGGLKRLAVAHVDAAKVELARELQEKYPPDPNQPGGVHEVVRTGRPVLVSRIPGDRVEAAARDDTHREMLRALDLRAYISVPLKTRHGTVGAISFVSAESGRRYGPDDLAFATEVAARAGLAVDNAITYAEAAEASRLKDEFLGTLSHELRTPLNAVLGYIGMMQAGAIKAERRDHAMAVVQRNAEALRRIVDDVLDVARVMSGKLRLTLADMALQPVLTEAIATVTPAARAKGIDLVTRLDVPSAFITGDADRLQQVFWNLLQNAVKFTPPGGTVTVTLRAQEGSYEVEVADTGEGITPAFLPHVFERFRQERSGAAQRQLGLGLGLAIVKELVEIHGGRVWAASAGPDRGATFTVSLPRRNDHTTGA